MKAETPQSTDEVLQRIEELEALKLRAIDDLLRQRETISESLRKLGHTDPPPKVSKRRGRPPGASNGQSRGAPRASERDEPCKVCGFKTVPAHDGRKHRGQGKNRKRFTPTELEALGLRRV